MAVGGAGRLGIAGAMALALAGPAAAADMAELMTSPLPTSGWIISLKLNGIIEPEFLGSDDYSGIGYPSFSFRKAGTPEGFAAADDGIDLSLFGNEYFSVGPVGRYASGRYNGSSRELKGLDSIPWTVQLGAYGEVWPTEWLRGRLEVRHGLNGNTGFVADVAADFVARPGPWTFSVGPRMTLGDGQYMDTYFGVTRAEANRNGRVGAYDPGGGIVAVGALAGAGYQWNERWTTAGYARYDRLVGNAADSPIVKKLGSPDQLTVGVTVGYSFGVDGF